MARIVLTTNGSLGDFHPFLAAGVELRARGHDIRFAVMDPFHTAVQAAGFPIDPLPNDLPARDRAGERAIYGSSTGIGSLRAAFRSRILPTLRPKVVALRAACAEADLLVSSGLQFPASFVADLTGIPWATITVTPLSLPSAFFAPTSQIPGTPPALRLAATRLSWLIGTVLLRQIANRAINDVRRSYDLLPRRNLMLDGNMSATFTSVAISSVFLPRPPDWPCHVHMTGFCFWDTPSRWQAPAELTTFLNASGPIIAVSSGSAAPTVHEVFTPFYRTSIEAIRRVGARARAPRSTAARCFRAALCAVLAGLSSLCRRDPSWRDRQRGAGAAGTRAHARRAVGLRSGVQWDTRGGAWCRTVAPTFGLHLESSRVAPG